MEIRREQKANYGLGKKLQSVLLRWLPRIFYLGDLKEFECQLCGTAIECMSYDYEDRRIFEIEMRRKLLIAL